VTLSVCHVVMETVVMDSTVSFIFASILQHPNVLQCVGQCVEAIPYLLVFEFCDLVSFSRALSWSARGFFAGVFDRRGGLVPALVAADWRMMWLVNWSTSFVTFLVFPVPDPELSCYRYCA
jgi:hypothetical protein